MYMLAVLRCCVLATCHTWLSLGAARPESCTGARGYAQVPAARLACGQTQSLVLVGLWSMHKLLSLNPSTQRPALPLAAWQRCTPCESHACHVCRPAICHAACLRLQPSCPGPPRCMQIPRELHSHTIIFRDQSAHQQCPHTTRPCQPCCTVLQCRLA